MNISEADMIFMNHKPHFLHFVTFSVKYHMYNYIYFNFAHRSHNASLFVSWKSPNQTSEMDTFYPQNRCIFNFM